MIFFEYNILTKINGNQKKTKKYIFMNMSYILTIKLTKEKNILF